MCPQGRSQAAPLTAWLRVPLAWFQSHTTSFFPDESHTDIRRTFTPIDQPHSKRNFCGFCGTHLSYWTEQPRSESDFLNVTIGSLRNEDLRALEELGLIPAELLASNLANQTVVLLKDNGDVTRAERHGTGNGLPWFDEMIEGSTLGRVSKTSKGMGRSADGTTTVEWEVTDWTGDGLGPEQTTNTSKRKIGDLGDGENAGTASELK